MNAIATTQGTAITTTSNYQTERTHYIHNPIVGTTIGYRIIDADDRGTYVRIAVSRTSPRDQFSRRIGRLIVNGRLDCPRIKINHVDTFTVNKPIPSKGNEWREFDSTIMSIAATL